jgi:hypothetical protein
MGWACGTYGGNRNAHRILEWIPERNETLGIARHIREDNIKRALQERGCEGVDRIDLTQDRYSWGLLRTW